MEIAVKVLAKLKAHGYIAYIVGGAVRDYLLAQPAHDIDITTNAHPEEVSRLFHAYPTGLKFGSVTINYLNHKYEVTTFRKDFNYLDARRPNQIEYANTPEEDALRRDFTINALMLDENLKVYDFTHQGLSDLKKRLIKAVGNPYERLSEDALRIMRAFYFVAKLDFEIEAKTMQAINTHAPNIKKIAKERITQEIQKMIKQPYINKAITLLVNSQVIKVLPSLKAGITLILEKKLTLNGFPFLLFIYLCDNNLGQDILLTNKEKKALTHFNNLYLSDSKIDSYLLYQYGLEQILLYNQMLSYLKPHLSLDTKVITDLYENLIIKTRGELLLSNEEIITIIAQKEGPWVKQVEEDIIIKVLHHKLPNDKTALKKYLKEIKNEVSSK